MDCWPHCCYCFSFLVTSDHGNSDDMVQREKKTNKPLMDPDTGKPLALTSHTLAPVPVYVGGKGLPDDVVMKSSFEVRVVELQIIV